MPGIIQSLIDRRHLSPLHQTNAWDHAKKVMNAVEAVMDAVEAEHVFAAWQEVKKAREGRDQLEVRVAVDVFHRKLAAWLNS